jgi:class 3 adenylate cyclase
MLGVSIQRVVVADSKVNVMRLLRTVVFVDAVDSSSQMRLAEKDTLATLQADLQGLEESIRTFGGEVNKKLGDGLIATFDSAESACRCTVGFLREIKDRPLKYRIGIHVGEVTFSEADIFGDAVNIAARLESSAAPNSVYASVGFYEAIRSQHGREWQYLGPTFVKGLDEPLLVYGWALGELPATKSEPIKSTLKQWWFALPLVPLVAIPVMMLQNRAGEPDSKSLIQQRLTSTITNYQPEAQNTDSMVEEVYNQFWDEISAYHEARDKAIRQFEPKIVIEWLEKNPLGLREKGKREKEHWQLVQAAIDEAKSKGAKKPDDIRLAIKNIKSPEMLKLAASAFEEEFGKLN